MRMLHFLAQPISDLIFSENSATTGGQTTLDYIPGSAFLGYCASKLYGKLSKDSYAVFHSGAVRFGNAYPLDSAGHITFPIPFSWHTSKEESIEECKNRLNTDGIFNLILMTARDAMVKSNLQPKQAREGFFSEIGSYISPPSTYRLKTAIDRTKGGRSKESQLFGYEGIKAGGQWHFSIEFDDEISPQIELGIKSVLNDTFRVGKSRTAEYGLVKAIAQNISPESFETEPAVINGLVVIYCLSDLALYDSGTCTPCCIPDSKYFNLDKIARFQPALSYIRLRKYSPFNGKRRAHDLERQVIAKGSIIVFNPEREFGKSELETLQNELSSGVGQYLYDGLGKVLVNPWFLQSEKPSIRFEANAKSLIFSAISRDEAAESELSRWIKHRNAEIEVEHEVIQLVEEWTQDLVKTIDKLSRGKAPGKSQWSQLRSIALKCDNLIQLEQCLFGEEGLCTHGVSKDKWAQDFRYESKSVNFGNFLRDFVIVKLQGIGAKRGLSLDEAYNYAIRKAFYRLGQQMPHVLNQQKGME